jgi:hypothetical protein
VEIAAPCDLNVVSQIWTGFNDFTIHMIVVIVPLYCWSGVEGSIWKVALDEIVSLNRLGG